MPRDKSPGSPERKKRGRATSTVLPDDYVNKIMEKAKAGSVEDMFKAANLYEKGKDVAQDDKQAFHWYQQAAAQGHTESLYRVGIMYEKGKIAPAFNDPKAGAKPKVDFVEARRCFQKAASLGHSRAQTRIGAYFEHGWAVASKDQSKACEWYLQAANNPNNPDPESMYWLGLCYSKGKGVQKDPQEAFRWFKRSAELKYARGLLNVGYCYERGMGVEQNYQQAAHYYAEAASYKNATAMLRLGLFYEYGKLFKKDLGLAKAMYERSASRGNQEAKQKLAVLSLISSDKEYRTVRLDELPVEKQDADSDEDS